MTRTEAIAIIEKALPSADEATLAAAAELLQAAAGEPSVLPRALTARELALIEQSKDGFRGTAARCPRPRHAPRSMRRLRGPWGAEVRAHEVGALLDHRARSAARSAGAGACPGSGRRWWPRSATCVYDAIDNFLARFPATKTATSRPRPGGLSDLARRRFVVLYDFDDSELRVHFIFHEHADLRDVDVAAVEW